MNSDIRIIKLFTQKCPHCYSGNIFVEPNMYKLSTLTKMNDRCKHCNESFRREPGFYFGAAYVSYGMVVALGFLNALFIYLLMGNPLYNFIPLLSSIFISNVLLMPAIFRYSRIIFLYMFVDFDPTKKKS